MEGKIAVVDLRRPSPPRASASAARRGAAGVAIFVATVAVVALFLGLLRGDPSPAPTGAAEWIWSPGPRDRSAPTAFFVAADFELDAVPAAAELSALADEEYVLYLNGRRVGSNSYSPGAPFDVYEVASLLRPGANRLAAELRSGRGSGGFLASLRDGGDRAPARRHRLRLAGGGRAGGRGGRRRLLPRRRCRRSPRGGRRRWAGGGCRPADRSARSSPRWWPPASGCAPERCAVLGDRPSPGARRREARGLAARRPGLLFDWGREVYGYLTLRTRGRGPRPAALLFTGADPVDPLAGGLRARRRRHATAGRAGRGRAGDRRPRPAQLDRHRPPPLPLRGGGRLAGSGGSLGGAGGVEGGRWRERCRRRRRSGCPGSSALRRRPYERRLRMKSGANSSASRTSPAGKAASSARARAP